MQGQFKTGEFRGKSILRLDSAYPHEGVRHYLENDFDILMLLLDGPGRIRSLDFIRDYPDIRGLSVTGAPCDITPLESLSRLRILILADFSGELNLGSFPLLEILCVFHSDSLHWPETLEHLEKLNICCRPEFTPGIRELPAAPRLKCLALQGGRMVSLDGIERFPALEQITLNDIDSLENIDALAGMTQLASVSLFNCHNIANAKVFDKLPALRELHIRNCGRITTPRFLKCLDKLSVFEYRCPHGIIAGL